MQDALRTYLGLAMGITEASRKQVHRVVRSVVNKGNTTADQIRAFTNDVLAARSTNREALGKLVRYEVERALGKVGLATADEVRELSARVRELEERLRATQTGANAMSGAATAKRTVAGPQTGRPASGSRQAGQAGKEQA